MGTWARTKSHDLWLLSCQFKSPGKDCRIIFCTDSSVITFWPDFQPMVCDHTACPFMCVCIPVQKSINLCLQITLNVVDVFTKFAREQRLQKEYMTVNFFFLNRYLRVEIKFFVVQQGKHCIRNLHTFNNQNNLAKKTCNFPTLVPCTTFDSNNKFKPRKKKKSSEGVWRYFQRQNFHSKDQKF